MDFLTSEILHVVFDQGDFFLASVRTHFGQILSSVIIIIITNIVIFNIIIVIIVIIITCMCWTNPRLFLENLPQTLHIASIGPSWLIPLQNKYIR